MRGFRSGGQLFAASGGARCGDTVRQGLSAMQESSGGRGAFAVPPDGDGWVLRRTEARFDGSVGVRHALGQWDATRGERVQLATGFNRGGSLMVALSGRFVNGAQLRQRMKEQGAWFTSHTDAELLAMLLSQSDLRTPVNRLVDALWRVDGGFAAVVMGEERLVAVCDPWGLRALFVGQVGDTSVIASTEQGLEAMGASLKRRLEAGEMAIIEDGRCMTVRPFAKRAAPRSIQDDVGLSRGREAGLPERVLEIRRAYGERLGRHAPPPSDALIVGMPGEHSYAEGYARGAQSAATRAFSLEAGSGWVAQQDVVFDRSVVLVADALADGARIKVAVHALKVAGAREVSLKVARSLASGACGWSAAELGPDVERTEARELGVSDLSFLSEEAYPEEGGWDGRGPCGHCHHCQTQVGESGSREREQLPLFDA